MGREAEGESVEWLCTGVCWLSLGECGCVRERKGASFLCFETLSQYWLAPSIVMLPSRLSQLNKLGGMAARTRLGP